MRTVVVDGPRSIRVETRPDPALTGPEGAIVAVTAAGICGSDLHFYEGDIPIPGSVALGHEAVGTVVDAGPHVRTVEVGDRVMVSSVAGCGARLGCATRDPVTCSAGLQIFGSGVLGGAQADLLAVPAADFQLLKIPDEISTEQALLLTDNLATGWAAARRADIPFGGTVAVIGLGAVGLCALRSALAQGAATVFAVDRVGGRLQRAAAWGATPIVAPAAEAIIAATGGRGADAVIDAVGTDASLTDAIDAVRPAGTVSVVGLHDLQPFPLPRPALPVTQYHAADDHRAGAAHLAGIDSAAGIPPARRRRHLHHQNAVGRSGHGLRAGRGPVR
ncbi:putative zinc-binding alcohol dehydrogenase [Mycobacterium pseudokansasii]|uniref:Putative zinc-binding alcohol dehydrogenase n=1 Tax=Mycobacterium pseudokansasii TaxID=2341080 RepID=A0A498QMM2_9MYCO|nr:putative zinc-binding alcohol dehydrogenase [Mycobacterium pseudokansasii]